jgi:hypothetical protein
MKTTLKIIIAFGIILNINAQSIEKTTFKVSIMNASQITFKFSQKLKVLNGINLITTPQFGNLFMTTFEAKKAWINLKDYYNDFDFGFNLGLNYKFKKSLNLKALYNVGILEFDNSDLQKVKNYSFKVSIDYVF